MEYLDSNIIGRYLAQTSYISAYSINDIINSILNSTDYMYKSYKWKTYDFNDKSPYDELNNHDERVWRWEIIRRNELFRRIWLCKKFNIRIPDAPSPARVAEDLFKMLWLSNPNTGFLDIQSKERKWKPSKGDIFPPSFDTFVKYTEDYRQFRIIYSNESENKIKFSNPFVFYASFDPTGNIKEQIKFITRYLQDRAQEHNIDNTRSAQRFHRGKWAEYLRAADAYEAGLSHSQVGLLLRNDPDAPAARNIRDQARQLIRNCLFVI